MIYNAVGISIHDTYTIIIVLACRNLLTVAILIVMFNFVFGSLSVALLIILKLISDSLFRIVPLRWQLKALQSLPLQHCSTLHDPAMARLITEITTTTIHSSSFVAVVGCGGGGGYIIIAPRSTCHLLLGLDC